MNQRRLFAVMLGASVLLICLTLLFRLSTNDRTVRFFSSSQVPLSSYNTWHAAYRDLLANIRPSDAQPHSRTLGVASHVYVLSLPHRVDRRRSMESLAHALDLRFKFVDGLEATDSSVDQALNILKRERKAFNKKYSRNRGGAFFPGFSFPSFNTDTRFSDGWFNNTDQFALRSLASHQMGTANPTVHRAFHDTANLLSCATPDDPFPDSLSDDDVKMLPPWRILSRGMVACWIAHVGVIHQFAKVQDENSVAIVLEDDVDMEFDIERRLRRLWPALPYNGWDIVMLGYCHSDEMMHPPLTEAPSVRPSSAPKCTHAYALSRAGARRLFQILSTPGFAYSRALDQAISWLIQTHELRSYSIVPAVVVQRKLTRSDIWHPGSVGQIKNSSNRGNERGSRWRDALVDSTLERVEMLAHRLGVTGIE